jgi:soluble lytic murein transglycosylase-like protein
VCDLATFAVNKFDQMVAEEISPTIEGWRILQNTIDPFNNPAVANKAWMHVPLTNAVKAEVQALVRAAAKKYGVPEQIAMNLAQQESGFDPTRTSPRGAMGVMQLMPGTAASLGVTSPYDAASNVDGGMRYLVQLYNMPGFGTWPIAAAAYNAGPAAERQILAGTRKMPKETQNYVPIVMAGTNPS